MNYIIQFIDGNTITITEDEYAKLAGRTGLVFIPSRRETLNMMSISRIYPEENAPKETDYHYGILHDGTKVVRQFGQWYCLDGGIDEVGRYETRPDTEYYPEVALDGVPSPEDFEKHFQSLSPAERKIAMCAGKDPVRYLESNDPKPLSELL